MIPYRPGHNPVVETWIAGQKVFPRRDTDGRSIRA